MAGVEKHNVSQAQVAGQFGKASQRLVVGFV